MFRIQLIEMLTFLFDILPDTGRIRFTLNLALLLHKRGYEVYYTDSSDSVFTSHLLQQGIGRILFPHDFQWFIPDLILLDYQLRNKAIIYYKYGVETVFIDVQFWGHSLKGKNAIPIIYLPPSDHTIQPLSLRLDNLRSRLLSKKTFRLAIISLLEEGVSTFSLFYLYDIFKASCIKNNFYEFILLTNKTETVQQLFPLPDNMSLYRQLDLPSVLPFCDIILTSGDLNTWVEGVSANLPFLAYPVSQQQADIQSVRKYEKMGFGIAGEVENITPDIFEQQINRVLMDEKKIKNKLKKNKFILST